MPSRRLQDMSSRRLQDMSSRRLQDVFSVTIFRFARGHQDVLQEVFKMSLQDVYKTYSRRLQDQQMFAGLKSLKIGILMRSFNPKLKMYELKIHRGVICHDNEE